MGDGWVDGWMGACQETRPFSVTLSSSAEDETHIMSEGDSGQASRGHRCRRASEEIRPGGPSHRGLGGGHDTTERSPSTSPPTPGPLLVSPFTQSQTQGC